MAREVDFVVEFNPFDRYRQKHVAKKGEIIRFVVQYETNVNGQWLPVVRYDTAHNFFHKDLMHRGKIEEKIHIAITDYNEALNFARDDIKKNWEKYKAAFMKEMKRYEN